MSLCSLKRQEPLPNKQRGQEEVSVEDFIQEAQYYASGQVLPFSQNSDGNICSTSACSEPNRPMKRATFTLTEEAVEQLAHIAEERGVAKSKMLRELIHQEWLLMQSKTRR